MNSIYTLGNRQHHDNSTSSQRARILQHLIKTTGSLTTLQARHLLYVMHPGMRVCELRKSGYRIATIWVQDITPEGNTHRVGQYILLPDKQLSLLDLIGGSAACDKHL